MNQKKTLKKIQEQYNLELDKAIASINQKKPKKVLLQLPDGLKPHATLISDYLKENTSQKTQISIWLGSCFGACDIPKTDSDLIIQFGHARWDL